MLNNGINIMLLDVDGPPKDLYPEGVEMTQSLWYTMLNNPNYPFGHVYIIAAVLLGLDIS